jgi:hypothetical protein
VVVAGFGCLRGVCQDSALRKGVTQDSAPEKGSLRIRHSEKGSSMDPALETGFLRIRKRAASDSCERKGSGRIRGSGAGCCQDPGQRRGVRGGGAAASSSLEQIRSEVPLKAVSACSMKNLSKVIALEFPGRARG